MAKAKQFKIGQTYVTHFDPKIENGTRFVTIIDREVIDNDLALITFRVSINDEAVTKKLYAEVFNYAGDERLEYVPFEYIKAKTDLLV